MHYIAMLSLICKSIVYCRIIFWKLFILKNSNDFICDQNVLKQNSFLHYVLTKLLCLQETFDNIHTYRIYFFKIYLFISVCSVVLCILVAFVWWYMAKFAKSPFMLLLAFYATTVFTLPPPMSHSLMNSRKMFILHLILHWIIASIFISKRFHNLIYLVCCFLIL